MSRKLTTAAVEKLRADPAKRLEIPDGLMQGLYLIVQPSGAKSWAVRYRHAGRPRKLTLGSFQALGVGAARQRARDALIAVAEQRDPAKEKRRAKAASASASKPDTFGAAARDFIERHAKVKNRSWVERARLLGLRPHGAELLTIGGGPVALWGARPVGEVTKADVRDLLRDIVDRGAGTSANRTLSVIRKLYNWLLEQDVVTASPCAGLKPPGEEKSRDRVLTDAELRCIWLAAEQQGYPTGRFVQMLILTAQRRREVAGMTRTELSLGERLWLIPRERTKNGREQAVPLSDCAMRLIANLPRIAGPYVFSSDGEVPISGFSRAKRMLDAAVTGIAKSAGIEVAPWALHDLRRTAASGMAKLGVLPHVLESALNHKSGVIEGVGAIYNKYQYAAEKREALEKWAQYFSG